MTAALLSVLLAQPGALSADLEVVYSKVAGEELKMDLYYAADAFKKPRPAVVVVHGGGWMSGKRQDMAELAKALAKEGMVAATVSYRLAPKHKWPAMLDDVQTAVRFLRSKAADYFIDPKRIGSCGASAGGHLSLLLGFRETRDPKPAEYSAFSSQTQAVFNIFGPTDFRRDFAPSVDALVETVLGKKKAEAAEDIRLACPVEWVTPGDAPVYTLHGEADPLVPHAQSKWLKQYLDRAGVKNELVVLPRMGHAIDPKVPEQMQAVTGGVAFLKRHLGG